jgi:amino acid transporter
MATSSATSGASETRPGDIGLRREVGLIGAIWASETSIIGSGWLFASMGAAAVAGPAIIYGWLIGGVCVIILALVHAELGGMYPVAGGTARFPHLAFGSVAGIGFGFFSWLQAVTVAPVEVYAVIQYGSYYWQSTTNPTNQWQNIFSGGRITDLGFVMAIVLMAIFTGLNFLAVKYFARVSNTIMWWKLAVPVLTIIVLLFYFHGSNFTAGAGGQIAGAAKGTTNGSGGFMPFGIKAVFGAIPGAGLVFSYLGFEQADQLAGEIKNAQRNLPRAVIISCLIGTVVYIMAQVVFIGATPADLLHNGYAGIDALGQIGTGHLGTQDAGLIGYPFAALAGLVGLRWLSIILHIDALVSPAGTGMIYQTSTSRVGYGLARNRYYPQVFQKTNRFGVPWVSLIVSFIAGLFFLLPFPSWQALVGLVTGASVLMYAGAPLALAAFRKQVPEAVRPYRVPGAVWFAPLAFIVANMIIYWSGFVVIWKLGVCIAIGYVLIAVCMFFDKDRPKLDWRPAQWMPVYIIGMGIISWLGQYPDVAVTGGAGAPPVNIDKIPFGIDIIVVVVFSLIIFYWAQATKLSREEMMQRVEMQSVRMGDEDATPAE